MIKKLSGYEYEYDEDVDIDDTDEYEKASFDAYIDWLTDVENEYYREPRAFMLDVNKIKELKQSLYKIVKYIKEIDGNAKITCEGYDAAEVPINKNAEIIIETTKLYIQDTKRFLDSVKFSSYISFIPT